MRLATRLKLTMAMSALVMVIVTTVLIYSTMELRRELKESEQAGEMLQAISSLRYLAMEYSLRHSERAEMQWRLRSTSLARLLSGASSFSDPREKELLADIKHQHLAMNDIFDRLVGVQSLFVTHPEKRSVLLELEARLTGQITNKSQGMITASLMLAQIERQGVIDAQDRANAVIIIFGVLALGAIATTVGITLGSVNQPLQRLQEGANRIGAGDLDFRLNMQRQDEIGDLALAFDKMTERLKTTTVSRDDLVAANIALQNEIVVRQLAEQRVQAQVGRLYLLHQITRSIGERQDLRSVFQVVVRSLEDQLPVDFCCVCLYDANKKSLVVTCVGLHSEPLALDIAMGEHARIAVDENGLSRCVRGQLVYEADIFDVPFPFPQRLARGDLRSLVMAPLITESTVFGVLVAARRTAHSFSSGDCEFIRQLSEHVALASNQAHLYGALQQAYDDLRQTQQSVMQQERLRALGQMASGIAHDINNAISPISLYTEILLETEDGLSAKGRESLTIISRAIDDVAATVARMREFYRQRGNHLTMVPTDLNAVIRQVLDLTRARWSDMPLQRGVVISMVTDFEEPLSPIMAAESEIREALTNLIFNSVDAMPSGGTITLRTRSLGKTASGSPREVVVEVIDTGVGMDEDARRRCLEPFFTTKGERGTGLGLAMVYGTVERHGANIEIESVPGAGTTMRLRFPVQLAEDIHPVVREDKPALKNLRLLVIDDDPLVLKAMRDILETEGHVVVTANGGQMGIDTFEDGLRHMQPFSAVITDLGMPYVDGRTVAARIKRASPATPIILLTGWGQRLIADGDVPMHVDHVLSKPPKAKDLRKALSAVVEVRESLPQV